MSNKTTAFAGLSHLGLITSIGWASIHPPVIAIDNDPKVIESLSKGKLLLLEDGVELKEPGLKELFQKVKKNYSPSRDFSQISQANLIFFAKDTPKSGINPEEKIFDLIRRSVPYFKNKVIVVIMSQVPVGFCQQVENYIKAQRPDISFDLYHWVDTIVMTDALERFLHPERIIIGSSNPTKRPLNPKLKSLIKSFSCPVFYVSLEAAELTKSAINLYLANSVTFANTLADFCEGLGVNINEIIPALRSDKRIGQSAYLRPTLAIAGGHLERDLSMLKRLAKKRKIKDGIVSFIIKQNKKRYLWAEKKINQHLGKKTKSKICLWGLSYKRDSTSTKNAASLKIINLLKNKSQLTAYDPMAILPENINGFRRYQDMYSAAKQADCLLILTEWEKFKKVKVPLLKKIMKKKLIIDAAGVLNDRQKDLTDFTYISMGG